jgi:hypothetical protein
MDFPDSSTRAPAVSRKGERALSAREAYVPEDAEQRTNHVYGLLIIKKGIRRSSP